MLLQHPFHIYEPLDSAQATDRRPIFLFFTGYLCVSVGRFHQQFIGIGLISCKRKLVPVRT